MSLPNLPHGWEQNEISRFLDAARANEFATFANLKDEVGRLLDIDIAYRKAIDGLNYSKDWFAGFFMLRAHSNFLAACRLCWSGQIPESYALLRSCIENGLYGLYLAKNPDSCEIWLRRHDDEESRKKVKAEFRIRALMDNASAINSGEALIANSLYERTIDCGAHPNELALMQVLKIDHGKDKVEFKNVYLDEDSTALRLAIKTTAQVGICTLSLFESIYPERFKILELCDAISHIKKGL